MVASHRSELSEIPATERNQNCNREQLDSLRFTSTSTLPRAQQEKSQRAPLIIRHYLEKKNGGYIYILFQNVFVATPIHFFVFVIFIACYTAFLAKDESSQEIEIKLQW